MGRARRLARPAIGGFDEPEKDRRGRHPQHTLLANASAKAPAKVPVDDTAGMEAFVPGDEEAIEAFELLTLAGALESLAGDLSASIEAAEQKVMADALEIYYAAEKLSKKPEHAHLIPYVEEMQAIYRRDFGREIPGRE